MKLQHLSTCIGSLALSAIALSVEPARAFNFTAGTDLGACGVLVDDLTTPLFQAFIDTTQIKECETGDGFTLTASDPTEGLLQGKLVDEDGEVAGVGITVPNAGPVPAEIQNGELLTATLDEASEIESIDLSFLYRPGVFFDLVDEMAIITATDDMGGTIEGILTVTGETSATWSLGGMVLNLDPSAEVEGGAYRINDPFGEIKISSLTFTAPTEGETPPRDSDYALVAIEKRVNGMEDVPEPATLLGLSVVGGLMVASRRRKSSQ